MKLNILKYWWDNIKNHTKLTLQRFIELLQFTFNNNSFSFDEKFYRQKFGIRMRNCLSPRCSDMSELQKIFNEKLPFKL